MLRGTLIKIEGSFAFDYRDPSYSQPVVFRRVWQIATWKWTGAVSREEDAPGRPAELREGVVNCSMGGGSYFVGYLANGGKTESFVNETIPVPAPKCKSPLRWHNGRWEKELKRGWVVA